MQENIRQVGQAESFIIRSLRARHPQTDHVLRDKIKRRGIDIANGLVAISELWADGKIRGVSGDKGYNMFPGSDKKPQKTT